MKLWKTVLILSLVAGCSGSPAANDEWGGTIELRDGVEWVLNPAPPAEPTEPAFDLDLQQTYGVEGVEGEESEAILGFITGVTVDGEGNVYVVDRGSNVLVSFAANGSHRWSAGREGEGPGEFMNAMSIAWDGSDRLYVANQNGGQIDVWTTGGEFVESHGLSEFEISQGYVVGLPDPDTLVLWSTSRTDGDGSIVHVLELGGEEWVRTERFFGRGGRLAEPNSEPTMNWGRATVRATPDSIWLGNRIDYELREYDHEGNLRRVIQRDHESILPTFVYKGTGFGFGEFEPPLWLSESRGLVPRYWIVGYEDADAFKSRWDEYLAGGTQGDVREYDSAIDLVDERGRVLGSLPVGGPFWASPVGSPELIGPDGDLYTSVFEPYPHVRRYRVVLPGEREDT